MCRHCLGKQTSAVWLIICRRNLWASVRVEKICSAICSADYSADDSAEGNLPCSTCHSPTHFFPCSAVRGGTWVGNRVKVTNVDGD